MMDPESVSTATLFEGQPPMGLIRHRVEAIVAQNPWLKGRLVRKKGVLTLQYSDTVPLLLLLLLLPPPLLT
jgi:hypothetical protein